MPLKTIRVSPSGFHNMLTLELQITETHPVRRFHLTREEMCQLASQIDRRLALQAAGRK